MFRNQSVILTTKRFLAIAKDKKPVKGTNEFASLLAEVEKLSRFYEAVESGRRLKPEFSEEELAKHAAIGKEYTRQAFIAHNALEKDLADKIWLQREAISALPPHLFEAAIVADESVPPKNRPMPVWDTPPVKDFDPSIFLL